MSLNDELVAKVCYTPLVFARVNKKLQQQLTPDEIKHLVQLVLADERSVIIRRGKNFYLTNHFYQLCLTINASTYRLITADKIND